jgi:hypothetical protein
MYGRWEIHSQGIRKCASSNRCRLQDDTKMVLKWTASLRYVLNWFILESSGGLVRYPPVIYKSGIALSNLTSVRFISILCLLSKFISHFGNWLLFRFQVPFHCLWFTSFSTLATQLYVRETNKIQSQLLLFGNVTRIRCGSEPFWQSVKYVTEFRDVYTDG